MKRFMKNNKRGGAIIPDAVKNGREHQDLVKDKDCEKYIEDLESGKIKDQLLASDLINGEYKNKCDPIFRPEETKTTINKDNLSEKDRYFLKELNSNAKEVDMYNKLKESDWAMHPGEGGKRKSRKQKSRKNKSKKNKSRRHRKKRN